VAVLPSLTDIAAGSAKPGKPPLTAAEKVIAGMWEELLGTECKSVTDNFMQAGGDSVLAVQLLARIEWVFQIELPISVLFETPTLEGVLTALNAGMGSSELVEGVAALWTAAANKSAAANV